MASKWILSRLSQVVAKCNQVSNALACVSCVRTGVTCVVNVQFGALCWGDQGMSDSEFHVATSSLYDFFLNEFCDVYLEYAKLYISGEVLRVRGCACFASSVH